MRPRLTRWQYLIRVRNMRLSLWLRSWWFRRRSWLGSWSRLRVSWKRRIRVTSKWLWKLSFYKNWSSKRTIIFMLCSERQRKHLLICKNLRDRMSSQRNSWKSWSKPTTMSSNITRSQLVNFRVTTNKLWRHLKLRRTIKLVFCRPTMLMCKKCWPR